ncbi:hypothetical protein HanXRQr2_Chr04g0171641 [Helianthus annuus]|uniref:Uncharacterized protein n=1 Tax=Helianthus annuus TaxID=4232 RepID=A0A9K3J8D3_HELAN|nr:hypothetical protein HanXRQr2_Chr04g0171641 [Helianthus annuus]KAJ0931721.1 hypothetical protein HanPSC8_Chr04g0165211 [Helianthus annuus]
MVWCFIWRHCSWRGVLSGDIVHGVVFYLETLFMAWCFKHLETLFIAWCFIWRHCSWCGVLSGDIIHVMVFYLESQATFYEYNTIQLNRTRFIPNII